MPAEITLQFEGRLLYAVYSGSLTKAEIQHALQQFRTLCDRATLPVHSLSDTTDITNIPDDIFSLLRSWSETFRHPRAGTFVIVIRNVLFATIVGFLTRIVPTMRVRTVSSIDQGWVEIKAILARETASIV